MGIISSMYILKLQIKTCKKKIKLGYLNRYYFTILRLNKFS